MKWMRTFGRWIIVVIVAAVLSMLSMTIQTGADTSESATIGIQKKWGFPIACCVSAPGLAWAQYDALRFGLNTLAWILMVGGTAFGLQRMGQRRSNKRLQERRSVVLEP